MTAPQSYSIFVKNPQEVFIFENFLKKVFPHAYCTSPNTTMTVLIRASLCPKVHFLKQIFGLNLNAVKPKNLLRLSEWRTSICASMVLI